MKILYLSLITLFVSVHAPAADPIDKIGEILGRGSAHELAAFFAPTIELTLLDDSNTYPKAQAEAALQRFFMLNKPVSSKMLHKVTSGTAFRFGVVIINTDNGAFRVAVTLKSVGVAMQVIELRVENEKVK